MLRLPNVTLICISSILVEKSLKALQDSCKDILFGQVKFLTHKDNIENKSFEYEYEKTSNLSNWKFSIHEIPLIPSKTHYSIFMIKELYKYVQTKHCLVVQYDGFVLNAKAWKEEFLEYDYIGAPWWFHRHLENKVGNGGFSLRSKTLICNTASIVKDRFHPEDSAIGIEYRQQLEQMGMKFPSNELASTFSAESEPYTNQFGWHGGSPPIMLTL